MKVYIVCHDVWYESGDVMEVFHTKKDALIFAEKEANEMGYPKDKEDYWGGDQNQASISVQEWNVK